MRYRRLRFALFLISASFLLGGVAFLYWPFSHKVSSSGSRGAATSGSATESPGEIFELSEKSYSKRWGVTLRRPLYDPPPPQPPAPPVKRVRQLRAELTGIMFNSQSRSSAIFRLSNNEELLVSEGETFGKESDPPKVTEIKPDYVMVDFDGRLLKLVVK